MVNFIFTGRFTIMNQHEWLLKRNCSLTPRQLASAYGFLCLLSFSVAMIFAWHGAWYVLTFSILEMAAVALAFLYYARHATDHEHVALVDGCLLVERIEAGHTQQIRLDPHWIRITTPTRQQDLISLEAGGVKVELGRFVPVATRRKFARELKQQLTSNYLSQAQLSSC